jgi:DNA repair exonuclease SbcCD nuclease subunit
MSTGENRIQKIQIHLKKTHKIQSKYKENCNDCMRIYIVSTVRIHKQKTYIPLNLERALRQDEEIMKCKMNIRDE